MSRVENYRSTEELERRSATKEHRCVRKDRGQRHGALKASQDAESGETERREKRHEKKELGEVGWVARPLCPRPLPVCLYWTGSVTRHS
jgi:hypothetical protein